MAKQKETRQSFDPETGEVIETQHDQVSFDEVSKQLEELRAGDKDKVYEWPDPRPLSPPLGYNPEPSLAERIRAMVRSEHLRYAAEGSGMETFEEADDFDVDDDFDPQSPYEVFFDPPIISPEATGATGKPVGEPGGGAGGREERPHAEANRDPVGGSEGASRSDAPSTAAKPSK